MPNCINNMLSLETFKDPGAFENWQKEKATHFENKIVENINLDFSNSFLAKFTGTVAGTFTYGEYIPTMKYKLGEQMANLAVLLTRGQTPNCINHVLSLETFKGPAAFENWQEDKATHFENEIVKNINLDFINSFLAKLTGTVAETFFYGEYIPMSLKVAAFTIWLVCPSTLN